MNTDKIKEQMHPEWWRILEDFFATPQAESIYNFLKQCKSPIFPRSSKLYSAFALHPSNTKVVILGQESYPHVENKEPVADGLAFSCGKTQQKSHEYLQYSIENTLGKKINFPNNLSYLREQGCLLLNYSLTVEQGKIGSHIIEEKSIWEPFYDYLFDKMQVYTGLVYILMGAEAQKTEKYINPLSNYILKTQHPAWAARNNNTYWEADRVWEKANNIITQSNGSFYSICWCKNDYEEKLINNPLPF